MILDSGDREMNKVSPPPHLMEGTVQQLTCLYLEGKAFYKWKDWGEEIWVKLSKMATSKFQIWNFTQNPFKVYFLFPTS